MSMNHFQVMQCSGWSIMSPDRPSSLSLHHFRPFPQFLRILSLFTSHLSAYAEVHLSASSASHLQRRGALPHVGRALFRALSGVTGRNSLRVALLSVPLLTPPGPYLRVTLGFLRAQFSRLSSLPRARAHDKL